MTRSLALLTAASALVFSAHAAAGASLTGSIYAPDIEVGAASTNPDGLLLDLRFPLNKNFWMGGTLATTLGSDQLAGGIETELGASAAINLGVQAEFMHHVSGYAYVGYGAAAILQSAPPPAVVSDVDGMGITWGAGLQFLLGDHMLIDAGYVTLFDDDMESNTGATFATTIAGPRVGIGFQF